MNKYLPNLSSQFKDKIIIVTGSTQGSGAETAKLFAHRGAKGITICGRKEKKGNNIKEEIEKIGSECIFVKADLFEEKDCRNIIESTDKAFGQVHCLVNVAGFTERGTILSTTMDNYENCFNVNTKAPFILMQDSIKIMIRENIKGVITSVLSIQSYGGSSFLTPYAASKGALKILTKNIASSLLKKQIRVNGLNLGWTDTPNERLIQKKYHKAKKDWFIKAGKTLPFKKLIQPIDVARVLSFMCSE